MRHSTVIILALAAALTLGGCDLVDPQRPTPQPDTTLFGNLLEVGPPDPETGRRAVELRVGPPRALSQAKESEGRSAPDVESGTTASVSVTDDTVILLDDRPAGLDEVNPGTELVVLPVPGSTRMVGTGTVVVEASYLVDFDTYQRWQLPRLQGPEEEGPFVPAGPVNSLGVEHAPVPLQGGRVLYFSARLRPPVMVEGGWKGALRPGMVEPEPGGRPLERSYRTVLGEDGWSEPELVVLPGLEEALVQRVSWVDESETRCLVTVREEEGPRWLGESSRSAPEAVWNEVIPFEGLGEGDAADGVYLRGSDTKVVFCTRRPGAMGEDLFLLDPAQAEVAQPLMPLVNTAGVEWGPRVGPTNELYFVRGDRQLWLHEGAVKPVRVEGPSRLLVTEAAPTAEGDWLFFCMPRLRPMELDLDIYVAPLGDDGAAGVPVAVDAWKP